ncbi:hypothetical protein ABEB36_015285 [Hypothenemus hampei]|uniref:Uncharacterized protein n=1 Tax=Hypothenemus hampei TaxID=57062 RepID=A0ABD1E0P3_HYPHA
MTLLQYCPKPMMEMFYGCLNTSNLKNPNGVDSNIAIQLFQLFKTLCHQSLEFEIEESLEMTGLDSESLESEDLKEENESEGSLSEELNSQMSLTESSEFPSTSEPTAKKREIEAD